MIVTRIIHSARVPAFHIRVMVKFQVAQRSFRGPGSYSLCKPPMLQVGSVPTASMV